MYTWIKVCGMRRREDIDRAIALGADAIGVIFVASSPRSVTPSEAHALVEGLPLRVARVGVFEDMPRADVEAIMRATELTHVQLHGHERVDGWRECAWPILRALRVGDPLAAELAREWSSTAWATLLDGPKRTLADPASDAPAWDGAWPEAFGPRPQQYVLAGGLTPETVAARLAASRAEGVDVARGVESAPGVKDIAKVDAFIRAVRSHA